MEIQNKEKNSLAYAALKIKSNIKIARGQMKLEIQNREKNSLKIVWHPRH
jgi:hypothetical protein